MTWCDPRGSLKPALIGAVALAVLLAGVGVAVHLGAGASRDGFVTRSGDSLMLNGQPFRFSGANIYWGGLDDGGRTGLNYPAPFRVDSALQTAADMGETVMQWILPGASYVRVVRDAGATGVAELGEVRITYP